MGACTGYDLRTSLTSSYVWLDTVCSYQSLKANLVLVEIVVSCVSDQFDLQFGLWFVNDH